MKWLDERYASAEEIAAYNAQPHVKRHNEELARMAEEDRAFWDNYVRTGPKDVLKVRMIPSCVSYPEWSDVSVSDELQALIDRDPEGFRRVVLKMMRDS